MTDRVLPRYPVYIPTKNRHDLAFTARVLQRDGVPFYLVVEPQEEKLYREALPGAEVLVLPFRDLGQGSIPARNWIKQHATENGHKRHWQLDDNISEFWRLYKGRRMYCRAGVALRVCEDFVDRYTNVAVAGLNYQFFVRGPMPPYLLNVHVYSCTLVLNEIPHQWRNRYNEDTDLCLQVLADGWCTVLLNAFMCLKKQTMTMKGGNSDKLYQGDGRLKMSRELERVWPGVVETGRRFKRPQHVIKYAWRRFDTPLIRRDDIDWSKIEGTNEYGMRVTAVDEVKSEALRKMVDEQ